ncbi:MAG TPA: NB-ARC domain-containing protein, partial [Chthoniobacterales bacterium]|nr:NB-ARC domain-containing protein [Chthoniobacterales bacterium]
LRPAVRAVGQLVTAHPTIFAAPLLTSNFDPLIEVSIRTAGGIPAAIFLAADGQFSNVLAPGTCQVVHLHGYWRGSDTLHTPGQITRNRPQLKGCLRTLLRETTLVVIGYGGWSDVFTRTLVEVIREQTESLNVLWTFYSDSDENIKDSNALLLEQFEPLAGQRVIFYKGVDCHVFLPRLHEKFSPPKSTEISVPPDAVSLKGVPVQQRGGYPPLATTWVGREAELRIMLSSPAKVIGITGMGGTGKSTLAAKYLEQRLGADETNIWCWADCREQSNTLHTQLVRMIEQLSGGRIRGSQLEQSNSDNVIEVLLELLGDARAILVFDNIDQYVDVAENTAVGTMNRLIELALGRIHNAQFVITGRPRLEYDASGFLQVEMSGLSPDETRKLFEIIGVRLDPATAAEKISQVHKLTAGHPLALNLIATQVAKNKADFDELLVKLKGGIEAGIENPILRNIWDTLNPKQQIVLRYLAEIVHPESEQRVASYFGSTLNYNQFSKAIKALKSLNLVVVKSPGGESPDTIELHPLIRDFIRRRFQLNERTPYIDSIIRFCDRMIGKFRTAISGAPWSVLENWTAKVELCLQSGRIADALDALLEVQNSLIKGGYAEEFVRLGLELLKLYEPKQDDDNLSKYDDLCQELTKNLSQLGRTQEADDLIESIARTVIGKTARYVMVCHIRSYSYWLRGDFALAKKWGAEGVKIKSASNLDTVHDCAHDLALAQRDSGDTQPALDYFLAGEKLEDVITRKHFQPERGGHYYGNIGRCLQFQGDHQSALECLRKSARLLDDEISSNTLMNNGWAAFWIGEILEAKNQFEPAFAAFRRAAAKWKTVSPARSREATQAAERVREELPSDVILPTTDWECDQAFVSWVQEKQ